MDFLSILITEQSVNVAAFKQLSALDLKARLGRISLIQIDQRTSRMSEIMGAVTKRQTQKQSAKETLAEVIKEMAKPRVAMSAREQHHIVRNKFLIKTTTLKSEP